MNKQISKIDYFVINYMFKVYLVSHKSRALVNNIAGMNPY